MVNMKRGIYHSRLVELRSFYSLQDKNGKKKQYAFKRFQQSCFPEIRYSDDHYILVKIAPDRTKVSTKDRLSYTGAKSLIEKYEFEFFSRVIL